MAVQKSFVVKNGLQVATNLIYGTSDLNKVGIGSTIPSDTLDVRGGIAATDIAASGYLTAGGYITASDNLSVAGIASFSDQVNIAGVTTLASSGGITTTGGDFYVGGDLYVNDDIVYDEVTGRNINITGIGTIVNLNVTGGLDLVGVTTGLSVSGVATFVGLSTFNDGLIVTSGVTTLSSLGVSGVTTLGNVVTYGNTTGVAVTLASGGGIVTTGGDLYVGGDLYIKDDITYDEVSGRELYISGIGTIVDFNATNATITGVLTASSISGSAQVAVSSEGTYIGAGASIINFASSTGQAWTVTEPSAGVATATVTPGASIGLVLALS